MKPEDHPSNWKDQNGTSPDPAPGWTWDMDSLETGEYMGFRLYQHVRERVTELNLPTTTVNRVLLAMIDMHDRHLVESGIGCATLIQRDNLPQVVSVVEPEQVPPLTPTINWQTLLQQKLSAADVNLTDDLDLRDLFDMDQDTD